LAGQHLCGRRGLRAGAADADGVLGGPGAGVDSPKVIVETAEARGVKSCGHADQASLASKGFITGAELKWGTV
jgi:hypothetical protein